MAPKKKAVKKAPSVGLRGKRKSVPPAAGLRPKKKPFHLKIGMVVECRDGHVTKPLRKNERGRFANTHPFRDLLSGRAFGPTGSWTIGGEPHEYDAVREVVKRRGK